MKALILLSALMFFAGVNSKAQTNNYRELIIQGKQLIREGNSEFSLEKMMKGRNSFERALAAKPSDNLAMYYTAYSDYRISTFIMKKNKDKSEQYIDEGINYAEKVIARDNKSAEAKALLATLYGIKMSFSRESSAVLGPKSNGLIAEAMELAPGNPRVIMQAGINKMYTPEFFGGSKTKALELFKKAASIFDTAKQSDSLMPDWGKTESMAWLGIDYENLGKTEKAVEVYKKALSEDPEFAWIKYSLLPNAENKLNKKQ